MIRFVEERGNLDFLSADSHNDYMVMAFTSHLTETPSSNLYQRDRKSVKEGGSPPLTLLSLSLSLSRARFFHFQIFEVEAARCVKWKTFEFHRSKMIPLNYYAPLLRNLLYHRIADIYVTFTGHNRRNGDRNRDSL